MSEQIRPLMTPEKQERLRQRVEDLVSEGMGYDAARVELSKDKRLNKLAEKIRQAKRTSASS